MDSAGGRVSVLKSGDFGPPMLLIHSINAAASVAEVKPLQLHYDTHRRVYCVDLPGFGASDRSDRPYTPQLMTSAVVDVARLIAREAGGPLDALAVSLSCEFLARAAASEPSLFRSIALVSPTGFNGTKTLRAPPGTSRGKAWVYAMLRGPGWGAGLYRQLTRPKVIRYFLGRTWGSKNIDEDLWQTDVQVARHPGAHFAPLYFLSATLFSADIHDVYDSLQLPVWVCHGTRGDFVDYRQLPKFAERGHWRVSEFSTGAMPYFENLPSFIDEYERFMAEQ